MADITVNDADYLAQVRAIRHALHIGLESYGEVERLLNEFDTQKAIGVKLPEGMEPIHPTGAATTIGDFATALRYLDHLEGLPRTSAGGV